MHSASPDGPMRQRPSTYTTIAFGRRVLELSRPEFIQLRRNAIAALRSCGPCP
jgi:hypothetical protein